MLTREQINEVFDYRNDGLTWREAIGAIGEDNYVLRYSMGGWTWKDVAQEWAVRNVDEVDLQTNFAEVKNAFKTTRPVYI